LSLPILLIMLTAGSLMNHVGLSIAAMAGVAIAYVASTFVFTLIGAWIYNLVAGMVGGFEFTTAEVTQG
jgi:hypothetical protein